jgi:peptide deformylase
MNSFSHCVGLAANQIGSDLNVFVADAKKNPRENSEIGFVVIANAKIIEGSDFIVKREGCMSVPDLTGNVSRARRIFVKGMSVEGESVEYEVEDFEARVFQHEIDHLSGKVFLDRVKSSRDIFARKSYRE